MIPKETPGIGLRVGSCADCIRHARDAGCSGLKADEHECLASAETVRSELELAGGEPLHSLAVALILTRPDVGPAGGDLPANEHSVPLE